MNSKLIARFSLRETMGVTVMGIALFWSAGKLNWWPAWALLLVMAAWSLATLIVILRSNPALLAERLGPRKGAKSWDTIIMGILGLTQLARYIVAGLDQRYGWSHSIPFAAQIVALVICVLSYALFVWATASNAYFSQIVRIQTDRDHRVVTGGPYRYVRHPGYLGAILIEFAISILLASWPVFWIGCLSSTLLIVRTALEDRTLQAELPGYTDYAQKVHYRLIPGIW